MGTSKVLPSLFLTFDGDNIRVQLDQDVDVALQDIVTAAPDAVSPVNKSKSGVY